MTERIPHLLVLSATAVWLAACGPRPPDLPTPYPTPMPPTPTPTPTAPALVVSDDLRAAVERAPDPVPGAPCGLVDVLDFPMGPPEGEGFLPRWGFGRLSRRYGKLHAGEDWLADRGSSFGLPVHAIGHGQVTYAAPLGWGSDQGVVIVRHAYGDGETKLSFYGHLDPDSVVLDPGACVARGDEVGRVGRPRTRPHLHFEIRDHMPTEPGPGYWPTDPRDAGWEAPSDYIWQARVRGAPGVQWTLPLTTTRVAIAGELADAAPVLTIDGALVVLDPADGATRWRWPGASPVRQAIVDAGGQLVYVAHDDGTVAALAPPGPETGLAAGSPSDDGLIWRHQMAPRGAATLMPLPGGGVVAALGGQLVGLSAGGSPQWRAAAVGTPHDWTVSGGRLVFTTGDPDAGLHVVDGDGTLRTLAPLSGRLASSGANVFVLAPDGVHRIAMTAPDAPIEHVVPLESWLGMTGHIVGLPEGGALVSHASRSDRTLTALNVDGSVRWVRSVRGLDRGVRPARLIASGGQVYGVTDIGDVLLIDVGEGEAEKVFDGGDGRRIPGEITLAASRAGPVLLDFRGGTLVALDPVAARASVRGEMKDEGGRMKVEG